MWFKYQRKSLHFSRCLSSSRSVKIPPEQFLFPEKQLFFNCWKAKRFYYSDWLYRWDSLALSSKLQPIVNYLLILCLRHCHRKSKSIFEINVQHANMERFPSNHHIATPEVESNWVKNYFQNFMLMWAILWETFPYFLSPKYSFLRHMHRFRKKTLYRSKRHNQSLLEFWLVPFYRNGFEWVLFQE